MSGRKLVSGQTNFFKMKILKKSVKSELSYLKCTPEVRAIPNDVSKAAYILENYIGDVEFSMTELCSFFCISRESLKKRMKAIALGHTYHSHHNSKYLAPVHEQRLVDMIVTSHAQNNSKALDDIPIFVWLINIYISLSILTQLKIRH